MSLLILIASIVLLLVLISGAKLNAFIALIVTAFFVGILKAMPFVTLLESIQLGIGNTLGSLVLIIAFGVILGNLLSDSGAAQRISSVMTRTFGVQYIKWAMVLTGFLLEFQCFITLVYHTNSDGFCCCQKYKTTYYLFRYCHGFSFIHYAWFLPPHPGPTAIAVILKRISEEHYFMA